MATPAINYHTKLDTLCEVEGMTIQEILSEATYDDCAASICLNPDCDYTTYLEPDARDCRCEHCKTQSVASCLILAGLI